MSLPDEIERLQRLRESGALSEEEFTQAKANLLNNKPMLSDFQVPGGAAKWWMVGLHLSQFAGYLAPLAGFVVPIVIWQLTKKNYPEIDEHGRMVTNWIISHLLYILISALLTIVGVGAPLLIVLAILGIVFPLIGAVRAAEGSCWKYPLAIVFLAPNN
jgi:uncharacterized Tic20 family protein